MPLGKKSKVILTAASVVLVAALAVALLMPSIIGGFYGQSNSGSLSVMFTDPPSVPAGVTAVYLHYDGVQVHDAHAASDSGWVDLKASGTVELTALVNEAQTFASSSVSTGTFNAVRFNVVSTTVTFKNSNYSAPYVGGSETVIIPFASQVQVNGGQTSMVLIDFTPTVLASNNSQSPQFNMTASARAYPVSPQDLPASTVQSGSRTNISSSSWWATIQKGYSAKITSLSLTPSSFLATIENNGTNAIIIESFEIATFSSPSPYGSIPAGSYTASFAVNSDGSLSLVNPNQSSTVAPGQTGYVIQPGKTATFTFSGNIVLTKTYETTTENIVAGNNYLVSLWGTGIYADQSVLATQ
jgi:hypothetical protein